MKTFTSLSQRIGQLGESAACKYLIHQGYLIVERNYTRKWGEIDIVASFRGKTHFIEVKSVSCESFASISHETDRYRPEDQMHAQKQKRLMRVIQTYMSGTTVNDWQFDLICVFLDHSARRARIVPIEDIILG